MPTFTSNATPFDHLDLIRTWFLFRSMWSHYIRVWTSWYVYACKPSDRLCPLKGVRSYSTFEGSSKHQASLTHCLQRMVRIGEGEGVDLGTWLSGPWVCCGLLLLTSAVRSRVEWCRASWVGRRSNAPSCSGSYYCICRDLTAETDHCSRPVLALIV